MPLKYSFKETTLSFPFKVSSNGSLGVTTDQKVIWANKVRSVISTSLQERLFLPNFGTDLNQVFWNTEGFAKKNVSSYVSQAFSTWLPTLHLDGVEVSDIDQNGELTILISYSLPNNDTATTSIGFIGISGNLLPNQETI